MYSSIDKRLVSIISNNSNLLLIRSTSSSQQKRVSTSMKAISHDYSNVKTALVVRASCPFSNLSPFRLAKEEYCNQEQAIVVQIFIIITARANKFFQSCNRARVSSSRMLLPQLGILYPLKWLLRPHHNYLHQLQLPARHAIVVIHAVSSCIASVSPQDGTVPPIAATVTLARITSFLKASVKMQFNRLLISHPMPSDLR